MKQDIDIEDLLEALTHPESTFTDTQEITPELTHRLLEIIDTENESK